jgi:AcrR family transcriptional regulator
MSGSTIRTGADLIKKNSSSAVTAGQGKRTASTRNAADTRERILSAARIRFSHFSYENVGTREIAADAGVDAALVSRYFGSKEKLFIEVLNGGFQVENHLVQLQDDPSRLADLGTHLATQVMHDPGDEAEFDALRVLLRASGDPAVAAIVSQRFHAEFVLPLAKLLRGRDAEMRAALIASYVIGLATMRYALASPGLKNGVQRQIVKSVGAAIQACID